MRHVAMAAAFASVAACGGGGDGGPTAPDLSGVWSGSWQGSDAQLGNVSGNWQVTITQGPNSASGAATLFGDVDCLDGTMQTNPSAQTAVTGNLVRPGCGGQVNWTLTALNVANGAAAGTWSNANTGGSGSLTGTRIATLTGPRIRFVSPPGGAPGTIVTIVGENLSGTWGPGALLFGNVSPAALILADATRLVAAVPSGAETTAIRFGTPDGSASSPFAFESNVMSPPAQPGNSAVLTFPVGSPTFAPGAIAPAAVAISPDGRKFYVADRGNGTVKIVRASTLLLMQSRDVGAGPRSLVASPDGKRVFVAVAGAGVRILDAASLAILHTASFTFDDGGRDNPQGVAISADGRTLLVSDGAGVRVYAITGDTLVQGTPFVLPGVTQVPLGLAFSPDGTRAYVAAADTGGGAGSLYVFNPANAGAGPTDTETVGVLPTAIAVSPDGRLVFVTNKDSNSVSVYDAASGTITNAGIAVGAQPTGVAVSPDGARVFVTNRAGNSISVINATTLTTIAAPNLVNLQAPVAIAINSRGASAYVAQLSPAGVRQVGGLHMLTVVLSGTGIGAVRSSDSRIDCGTACQAEYPSGSVTLSVMSHGASSRFNGWSGICNGSDLTITFQLAASGTCTATFNAITPPPSQQNQNPNGCFIATAAYGTDMAHEVQVLRELRDRIAHYAAGRAFVEFYYRNSPPIAERIRESDGARAAVRAVLWPVVWSVAHPAPALLFVFSCGLLGWSIRARR